MIYIIIYLFINSFLVSLILIEKGKDKSWIKKIIDGFLTSLFTFPMIIVALIYEGFKLTNVYDSIKFWLALNFTNRWKKVYEKSEEWDKTRKFVKDSKNKRLQKQFNRIDKKYVQKNIK